MKKIWIIVLLMIYAFGFFSCGNKTVAAKEDIDAQVESSPPPTVETFGVVTGQIEKSIYLEFNAYVQDVHIHSGYSVKKGDSLITLDVASYEKDLMTARSNLAIAEYKLEELEKNTLTAALDEKKRYQLLKNNIRFAENELEKKRSEYNEKKDLLNDKDDPEIKSILNDLEKGRNELKTKTRELENKRILFLQGALAEQVVLDYEKTLEESRSQITSLNLSLESLINSRSRELTSLNLLINQKQVALDNLKLEMDSIASPELLAREIQKEQVLIAKREVSYLKSKSDRSFLNLPSITCDLSKGIVTFLDCKPGDFIPSGKKIISILDTNSLIVEARISEEFISKVNVGDEVIIRPLADSTREFSGTITRMDAMAINFNNETVVPVVIHYKDEDGFLLPNFNVDVEIFLTVLEE